jgi:hypothetical protein
VILYWWSPIPVLEFAFSAHLDVEAIVWTLAALLVAGLRFRGARLVSGALLGMGTLTKFYPALFSVVMVRKRRDWVVIAGLVVTVALGYAAFWRYQAQSGGFLSTYIGQSTFDRGLLLGYINTAVTLVDGTQNLVIALQLLALAGLCLLVGWYCWRKGLRMEAGVLAINVVWILVATHIFTWYIAVLLPLLALYLRLGPAPQVDGLPTGEGAQETADQKAYPTDLSGRYATPALGIWFFSLAMPFTYVYFAAGAFHPDYFKYSFYLSFAIAALPLLTRQGRAALRQFLRFSTKPAISGPDLAARTLEEYPHAIDSTEPSAGQPAWQWWAGEQRDRSAATRAVSGDD